MDFKYTDCDYFTSVDTSRFVFIGTVIDGLGRRESNVLVYTGGSVSVVNTSGLVENSISLANWFTTATFEKKTSPCNLFVFDPRTAYALSASAEQNTVISYCFTEDWTTAWSLAFDSSGDSATATVLMVLPNNCMSLDVSLNSDLEAVCIDPQVPVVSKFGEEVLSAQRCNARVMVYDARKGWSAWPVPLAIQRGEFSPVCVRLCASLFAVVFERQSDISDYQVAVSTVGVVWRGKRVDKGSLRVSEDGEVIIWRGVDGSSKFVYACHSQLFAYFVSDGIVRCLSPPGALLICSGFFQGSSSLVWYTEQKGISSLETKMLHLKEEERGENNIFPPITSNYAVRGIYKTESPLDKYPHLFVNNAPNPLPTSLAANEVSLTEWRFGENRPNLRGVFYAKPPHVSGPIVFYLHGGPGMAISPFRKSVEYFLPLISAGFRVLNISYSGSLGFGDEYAQSVLDLCDLEEVINRFRCEKIACVFGSSYGGFLALHAFSRPHIHTLVPCFVALYPYVSSAGCARETGDFEWEQEYDETNLEDINLTEADIEKPLLLLHGDQDPVCPISQSMIVYNLLRKMGSKKVELVKYSGEGHGFKMRENKLSSVQRVSRFIADSLAAV